MNNVLVEYNASFSHKFVMDQSLAQTKNNKSMVYKIWHRCELSPSLCAEHDMSDDTLLCHKLGKSDSVFASLKLK